jgi:hypothetical protein
LALIVLARGWISLLLAAALHCAAARCCRVKVTYPVHCLLFVNNRLPVVLLFVKRNIELRLTEPATSRILTIEEFEEDNTILNKGGSYNDTIPGA